VFEDRMIPLQTLDEAQLGLAYEANFPQPTRRHSARLKRYLSGLPEDAVRNRAWMRTYLIDNPHSRWGLEYNVWLIGDDRWVISGRHGWRSTFVWDARLADVQAFLVRVRPHRRVVFHIHPVYIDLPESVERAV
jgi:hypothetical protein